MKITCQSCQSKYTVSDEKVQGRTVKIKCRKCSATILVNSTGATNGGIADPESVGASLADGATYLVNMGDGEQRSMSVAELIAGYGSGVITADTYVWADGMADWQPLGQVEAIVSSLTSTAAVSVRSALQEAPASAPGYGAPAVAQPSPATSSETTSGMHRAAVRRDPARPSQDLFGPGAAQEPQRVSTDDVATSAPLFSSKPTSSGQRDENSMLFSLSALTAKTGTSVPSGSSSTSATKDDSGLIDLKALSAGANAPSPVAALVPDDGGLFQLSAPIAAPTAAPSVAPIDMPAQKNRGALYIGIGVAVAGLAIAGAFFGMKGSDPSPASASPGDVAQVQTAAPMPSPTPPEPTTKAIDPGAATAATASATASATAVVAKPPVGGRPAGTRPGATTGGTKPPATTAAPATTKPRSGGNCGCAPSDLMCNMQCSAKGK